MAYKINLTDPALEDLNDISYYLSNVKKNPIAAQNFLADFEETKRFLECAAEAVKICENISVKGKIFRRTRFRNHKYYLIYRVEGKNVIIDAIFHELQEFEGYFT